MLKTPFESTKKITETIQENEQIWAAANQKFETFNKWWLYDIV